MDTVHQPGPPVQLDSWEAFVDLSLVRDPFDDGAIPDPFADDDDPGLADLEAPMPGPTAGTFAGLPRWAEAQAAYYDSLGTPGGDLAAWALRRLAADLDYHGAATVADLEARIELAEDARDAELLARGRDSADGHERYSVGWARFVRDECGDPSELDRELAAYILHHNP